MTRVLAAAACAVIVPALAGAQRGASRLDDIRTVPEKTDYLDTSKYSDVVSFLEAIDKASDRVHLTKMGTTNEQRAIPLAVIGAPGASPQAVAGTGKLRVYIQGNIHGGEVEGKESAQMLLRDLAAGRHDDWLQSMVFLIAPIYNADGNEKVSPMNRTSQNGPVYGVGTRENSKGFDLNRDYMKLDTAEARSLVGFMNKWDPHVLVDLHTTNGSYHGYHLTYSPILNPNADPRLIEFTKSRMLAPIREAMLKAHNWRVYDYGNFAPEDGGGRENARIDPANPGNVTWRTFDHRPRFGNNYAGLRNRIAILSEAYSYLDFKGRVEVTEDFVAEIYKAVQANAKQIMTLTAQADRVFTAPANGPSTSPGAGKPVELGVDFSIASSGEKVEILVSDVTKVPNPRSGREMLAMATSNVAVLMKEYLTFTATRSQSMPKGWLIPKTLAGTPRLSAALDRLRWHGIKIQEFANDQQLAVERFSIAEITKAPRPFQGHQEARLKGAFDRVQLTVDAGSLFIPANQPLARLAFYLIEPESDDGLVTWNVIDEGLAAGQTYPIYRVVDSRAIVVKSR
ncbi:MAG TPA: M14 family metallopeptidase [Vicinamibacterales bacterium]|nr:M14 family metallopeptidase [Vicinamibacterales bacterium]